jgi:hypothetical protein
MRLSGGFVDQLSRARRGSGLGGLAQQIGDALIGLHLLTHQHSLQGALSLLGLKPKQAGGKRHAVHGFTISDNAKKPSAKAFRGR